MYRTAETQVYIPRGRLLPSCFGEVETLQDFNVPKTSADKRLLLCL